MNIAKQVTSSYFNRVSEIKNWINKNLNCIDV